MKLTFIIIIKTYHPIETMISNCILNIMKRMPVPFSLNPEQVVLTAAHHHQHCIHLILSAAHQSDLSWDSHTLKFKLYFIYELKLYLLFLYDANINWALNYVTLTQCKQSVNYLMNCH